MREIIDLIIAELRGSWRYRWLAIAAAWLVCLAGWVVVYWMEDTFESKAIVLIDTTSDLDSLLDKLTIGSNVLNQIEMVKTVMLGRPQLEQVARETDLHLRANTPTEMDKLISGLRSRISITSDNRRGSNIYRITYRDSEPEKAYKVVNTLLNNFVGETLGANREGTQRAQQFLRDEIKDLEADLTLAEDRLAKFKRENVGRMPGERGDYFARLEAEMLALESTQAELRQVRRSQEALRQQLAGEQPSIDASGVQSEVDQRIDDNQRRLEELQLRFTDLHPDVIALKTTLEQLRQQKQEQMEALLRDDGLGVISDNPVFQNIQIELTKINSEIASLREKEATHQRKIAELQGLVDILPEIEAELARLNRDYGVKQAQYQSLLQRLEVAELSESADENEEIKFQVVDPPLVPKAPVAPNRPILLALILLVGLGIGGGVAFLANQLKPIFTDPKTIRDVTGFPVLGTVRTLDTREHRRQRMAELGAFGSAIGALCLVFVVVFWKQATWGEMLRSIV